MRLNNTQTNYFYGDAVFQGGLSALSGAVFTNTIFTSTTALSVINTGIGPALYVAQAAGNYDIASFYDLDGVEVLHVGNAPSAGQKGNVGINESNPGAELTVNGAISGNNGITVAGTASFGSGSAYGIESFAAGKNTLASGTYSHAEGLLTSATNVECHAEGYFTLASGNHAHAEGDRTVASGDNCHAQGSSTWAKGNQSHTEGYATSAFGAQAHAEGANTYAEGNSSHAEGWLTSTIGTAAHAEGYRTLASGAYSHTEGQLTSAFGAQAHAEGFNTSANGSTSHAAGRYAAAAHDRTWIWKGSTATDVISTTRTDQFMVSAAGGVFIPGNVGIGTDNNTNALTVNGSISTNGTITASNGNSDNWNAVYTNVATLSSNITFNLYLRNANLATLTSWTSAVSIPANINQLTGGGACVVTDILCIIKNRSLNAGVPTTGNLFSTRPGFALEDNSGNSFCSTAIIGKAPVVGAYYRTANNVLGTDSNTGKFTYNGGAARVVGATLPVYITTTLTSAVNGTTFALPINVNTAFGNNGFHVKVDDEIMYVSNVTGGGTSMTVTRGQLGTAQVPHDPGATVTTNIATNDMLLVDACFVLKRFDN